MESRASRMVARSCSDCRTGSQIQNEDEGNWICDPCQQARWDYVDGLAN